jgi:hypothetical protein
MVLKSVVAIRPANVLRRIESHAFCRRAFIFPARDFRRKARAKHRPARYSAGLSAFTQFCAVRQRSPLRARSVALRLGRVTDP